MSKIKIGPHFREVLGALRRCRHILTRFINVCQEAKSILKPLLQPIKKTKSDGRLKTLGLPGHGDKATVAKKDWGIQAPRFWEQNINPTRAYITFATHLEDITEGSK